MKVFILANCKDPSLFGATRMVFDTLRVGFPSADVHVTTWGWNTVEIHRLCDKLGAHAVSKDIDHPRWIAERIVEGLPGDEQFFLCDTDVIFWDSIEDVAVWGGPMAGRFIPEFYDEFTQCRTMPRLHTSLLYINPPEMRKALHDYHAQFPNTVYDPTINLLGPVRVPTPRGSIFFDGGSLLYNAVGGTHFGANTLNRYDHLHCGCTSNIVSPHLTLGRDMTKHNLAIINNPELARGIWRQQEAYFEHFAATPRS